MGNADSTFFKRNVERWFHADVVPEKNGLPKHDPQEGFQSERKPRVSVLTDEEMSLARIPPEKRDYCAHLYLEYKLCQKKNLPFSLGCSHEKHAYDECQYADLFMRMKEYERERRLNLRDQRRKEKEEQVIS